MAELLVVQPCPMAQPKPFCQMAQTGLQSNLNQVPSMRNAAGVYYLF